MERWRRAERHMRAVRRTTLACWYATVQDTQAALIEATSACLVVNVFDESVFEVEHGTLRASEGQLCGRSSCYRSNADQELRDVLIRRL